MQTRAPCTVVQSNISLLKGHKSMQALKRFSLLCKFVTKPPIPAVISNYKLLELVKVFASFVCMKQLQNKTQAPSYQHGLSTTDV